MATKLFIPGPTEVSPEILAEMSRPMMGHRSKAASELQRRISDNLRRILYTQSEIILSTSSGTGLMEGAVRSCTAKRAAIFSVGAFGKKWFKIAKMNGVPADFFESPFGEATTPEMVDAALSTGKYDTVCITHNETSTGVQNPFEEIAEVMKKYPDVVWCADAVSSAAGAKIETDKLGVDVLVTSTQKALALPPGMAICTLSPKAYERTAHVENRGCYFDLRDLYDVIRKKDYQYANTPCVSIMYAMDLQLQRILRENPVLRLVLGCCSALAITTTVSGAIGMGLSMTFVLVCSNIVISALRKAIPDKVHLPCYIVIIAAFVTIVQMVLQAYVPDLYESLGVFLALIVVNCIILGRAEMFACKHTVVESALDGLGMGLGYILTMTLMSSIREILGNGSWMGIQIIPESVDRMGIMNQAPGGFFVFGCLMALCIYIERKLNRPIERKTCGDVMLEELEAAKAENGEGGDQA